MEGKEALKFGFIISFDLLHFFVRGLFYPILGNIMRFQKIDDIFIRLFFLTVVIGIIRFITGFFVKRQLLLPSAVGVNFMTNLYS